MTESNDDDDGTLGKPVPSSVLHIWFPTSTSRIPFRPRPFLALRSEILRVAAVGARSRQVWRHRRRDLFLTFLDRLGLAFWALLERLRGDIPIVVVCCWATDGGVAGLVGPRTQHSGASLVPFFFATWVFSPSSRVFLPRGISVGKHLSGDGIGFCRKGLCLWGGGRRRGSGE